MYILARGLIDEPFANITFVRARFVGEFGGG